MTCGFHSVEEGHFIGMMIRFQINLGIHIPQYLHNEILSINVELNLNLLFCLFNAEFQYAINFHLLS